MKINLFARTHFKLPFVWLGTGTKLIWRHIRVTKCVADSIQVGSTSVNILIRRPPPRSMFILFHFPGSQRFTPQPIAIIPRTSKKIFKNTVHLQSSGSSKRVCVGQQPADGDSDRRVEPAHGLQGQGVLGQAHCGGGAAAAPPTSRHALREDDLSAGGNGCPRGRAAWVDPHRAQLLHRVNRTGKERKNKLFKDQPRWKGLS